MLNIELAAQVFDTILNNQRICYGTKDGSHVETFYNRANMDDYMVFIPDKDLLEIFVLLNDEPTKIYSGKGHVHFQAWWEQI